MELTHLDKNGSAVMVDVGGKDVTRREARAFARVRMQPATLQTLLAGNLKKGDALAAARIAGIMAAKRCISKRRLRAATRPALKWKPSPP